MLSIFATKSTHKNNIKILKDINIKNYKNKNIQKKILKIKILK